MAGNKKIKRKKKKTSTGPVATTERKPRRSTSQVIFIALGALIILSMVISLVANFGFN
jgi:hypothetical protein